VTNGRYILDTNVLVSALLVENGAAFHALEQALATGRLIFSSAPLGELITVLTRRKFDRYFPLARRLDFANSLHRNAILVTIGEKITACRDPKDDKFLEAAASSGADMLVTGDDDLLTLNPFRGITILTPRDFLASSRE
jgi:putative PIN family toxin of toxin-antitoxin system